MPSAETTAETLTFIGIGVTLLLFWIGLLFRDIKASVRELWTAVDKIRDDTQHRLTALESGHQSLSGRLSDIWVRCFGGHPRAKDCDTK